MPTTETPEETLHLTLSLPKVVAEHIRAEVATGVYTNATDYIESMLLSETLFEPIDQDKLTHWINTEGVRRLRAMEADPSRGLTEEQVFGFLDEDTEETDRSEVG